MTQATPARPRLIIADDHAEMRKRIADVLVPAFDVVAAVADGQEAVEAADELQPEVVILDIAMPVLNGIQAAATLRKKTRPPKILFVTAVSDSAIGGVVRALGAPMLVLKRDMLDELVPAVRHALATPYTHAVCFHPDTASLSPVVARFIGEGLAANQPALVIAPAPQHDAIRDQLADMGIDSQRHVGHGDLAMLDANALMTAGAKEDMSLVFGREVVPIVARMRRGGLAFPRIFGTVGGLLWGSGQDKAALSLEAAWNGLDLARWCSVLCGYAADVAGEGMRKLCEHHDTVVPVAS